MENSLRQGYFRIIIKEREKIIEEINKLGLFLE